MKQYPNMVLLTALEPGTHRHVPRWFKVESPEHEAQVRTQVRKSVEQLDFLLAMAEAAKRQQLIEYIRREADGVK